MVGLFANPADLADAISRAPGAATCIVVKHPDGSLDGTMKVVYKSREIPENVVQAANVVLAWARSKSVVLVAGKDGALDRAEAIMRLR